MAGHLTNEGSLSESDILVAVKHRFAIIVAEWNPEITNRLKKAALDILNHCKVPPDQISVHFVPGSFELTLAAQWALTQHNDAVLCLGCIIKGQTIHDKIIAQALSQGIMDLNLKFDKPVIFGVLTVDTQQQALDRSGGSLGNKGAEAAITAIKMLGLKKQFDLLQ